MYRRGKFPKSRLLSAHSRKTLLKLIKRVFQIAVEDGILERNPAVGIKVPVPEVEQKFLTNEEVKIFLDAAKQTGHRFYPVWLAALMTGMRSGELFALTWADIDLDARLISVNKQWTNKTGIGPTNEYFRKAGAEIKGWTEKLGYSIPNAIDTNLLQFAK